MKNIFRPYRTYGTSLIILWAGLIREATITGQPVCLDSERGRIMSRHYPPYVLRTREALTSLT